MAKNIEKKRDGRGRPPLVIDLSVLETLAGVQCTHKQIAAAFRCTERTIIKKMKKPEVIEAYERGKENGKLNLKQLQWRHAQGLDPNGKYISGSQSAAVSMTIHLSKQWLGETDKTAVEVNPIELVITRIERVIVECSPDRNRQSLPPIVEAQAIQGR